MKVKSAVLREINTPYRIEELELEPPKKGEVLVRNAYCGYCHSDLSMMKGSLPPPLPFVAGHECSGVVEDVGSEVTRVKKGDHFIGTFSLHCGTCVQCQKGNIHLCQTAIQPFIEGTLLDGSVKFKDGDGTPVHQACFLGGFSTYSVLSESSVIPIPRDLPLDQACLIGCCVPTGWGTVTKIANVGQYDSVAVYGMGGVGLNVLRAAVIRNANPVIAVDLEESKEDIAYEFGATHFICSSEEDPVPKIQELTGGGADCVFDATGDPGPIIQAWWSTGVNGKLVIAGVTGVEETTTLPLFLLTLHQKSILGSAFGNTTASVDIPRLANMLEQENLLKLDKLITKKFKLSEINDVAEAMTKRQIKGRWICALE